MRRVILIAGILSGVTQIATAQQTAAPAFEVASIKPWSPPTTRATSGSVVAAPAGSGIFNRSTSAAGLIAEAYEVQDFQLSGGEDWVRAERYDVAARAGREVSQTEIREMVKTLLADRFKLRVKTPDLPSFEGALREQLGLRLERTRGPVPVVVIESIERPTPN